jgi:hypothetical protein
MYCNRQQLPFAQRTAVLYDSHFDRPSAACRNPLLCGLQQPAAVFLILQRWLNSQ